MTNLSINLNKIALLRNSRGRDYPNLIDFAAKFVSLGVQSLTIHPRQDERHIKKQDARELAQFLTSHLDVELNIEGYPSDDFLLLVDELKPSQCSLVPDSPNQLTSDHGWDLFNQSELQLVTESCKHLNTLGVRSVVFIEPDIKQICQVPETGAERIELYTENYASNYHSGRRRSVLYTFRNAAIEAQKLGIGVNAGHDLDLCNLEQFLTISNILEVSIGHALVVECIEQGLETVVRNYLSICNSSSKN